jgi:uncharacterized membrane protein YphA (DoxX/SURF4 family)
MTALATPTSATAPRRTGAGRIALWVLQVVLAAVFLFAAWGKITLDPMTVAGFDAMGLGATGAVVIGVLETLGAIGLLVPRIAGLASAALVALMIGATLLSAVFFGFGPLLLIPGVTLALVAVVAVARRREVREVPAFLAGLRPRG